MRKNLLLVLLGVFMISSYFIQKYTIFAYLEIMKIWPPTIFAARVVCAISFGLSLFLTILAEKSETKNHVRFAIFWIACASLFYPWVIKSIDALTN